ncbi:MAG: sigma-54-dependent Fis family transcriptional regulator, partial [Gammaproteobacteria bacterium]|nr:sigma-54-dependent Fis family transcriptional regulator [Gammaproteobacteria bacterium]
QVLLVLQEGEVRPLGSGRTRVVDVRIIAATNRNLEEDVFAKQFRADLFYRLATVEVHMLPLRQRQVDIPVIATALLQQAMRDLGKESRGFEPATMAALTAYAWPGNVRELQNEIRQMLVMASGDHLGPELLNRRILEPLQREERASLPPLHDRREEGSLREQVEALEQQLLFTALQRCRGNKSEVARQLGLSRVGLRNKLLRYNMVAAAEEGDE